MESNAGVCLERHILSPCWMKLVLVLLLKWEDLHWKGPEISLSYYEEEEKVSESEDEDYLKLKLK